MPELPEVETVVRDLKKNGLEGCRIQKVIFPWPRTAATLSPNNFHQHVQGRQILKIFRRAKFIVLELSPSSQSPRSLTVSQNAWLLIHLRMTGRLDLFPAKAVRDPYVRAAALLDDGRELRFKDIRKFGRWYFYDHEPPQFKLLGPEPLSKDFTLDIFMRQLAGHNRQVKPLLLDQTIVAGLGNIYVDEALFEARIHPLALSGNLNKDNLSRLHKAIVKVLTAGVRNSGTTLGRTELNYYSVGKRRGRNQDQLQVFRKDGEPCPRCGLLIQRLIVGQRSSHVCSHCQKKH